MKRTHKRTHTHVLHRSNNMTPIRKPITSIAAVFAFRIHRTLSGTRFRFGMIRVSTNIIECRIAQTQLTDGIYAAEQNIWNVRTLTLVHGSASGHPSERTHYNKHQCCYSCTITITERVAELAHQVWADAHSKHYLQITPSK
jgi:hypothetical protein